MLDLTIAERQELEAEFDRLNPEERALFEAVSEAARRAVNHMIKTLDSTNRHLEQSFRRLRVLDLADERFQDHFVASRWLLTANPELSGRTPLSVVKDKNGPERVAELLHRL